MAMPFAAANQITSNGPTDPFRYTFGTPEGGLRIFVVSMAATGVWDGATVGLEFFLGGEWHRTVVSMTETGRFWKIGDTAAIIGESYRFVIENAGPATRLYITVASPWELHHGRSG